MTLDPYHKWLGIPPAEQPPNHYRLLAIGLFEDDPDVIESAADQRMGHLRTFQTGQHSALSQKLLNELSAAKLCLLNPQKKAEYDAELRRRLAVAQPSPQPVITEQPITSTPVRLLTPEPLRIEPLAVIVTNGGSSRQSARKRRPAISPAAYAWLALAAAALPTVVFVVYRMSAKPQARWSPPTQSRSDERNLERTKKLASIAPVPEPQQPPRPSSGSAGGAFSPQPPRSEAVAKQPPADTTNGLKVIEARWGAGRNSVDVTTAVQAGVRDDRYLATAVTSALGGKDPAHGWRKQLLVRYRIGGQTRSETFNEDQVVYLAADDAAVAHGPGLTLLEAKYGGGDVWVDVLDRIRPLVNGNALSFRPDRTVGVDPLPGATKVLFIRYALNGKPARASVLHHEVLSIGSRPVDAIVNAVAAEQSSLAAGASSGQPAKPAAPVRKPPSLGDLVDKDGSGEKAKLTATQAFSLKQHTGAVTRVAFHRTQPVLASAGKDGRVLLWDLETRASPSELHFFREEVWAIKFTPDGSALAFANRHWWGSRLLFKTLAGLHLNEVKDFKSGGGAVASVAYSPDGRLFAAGQDDGTIRLWDVAQLQEVAPVGLGDGHNVYGLAFGPVALDRRSKRSEYLLAAGGQDGVVRTLKATLAAKSGSWTFQPTTVQFPKAGVVIGVRFSRDGKLVGFTRAGGNICLCNTQTGEKVRELAGGARGGGSVEWIAFHPQQPWCVTAHKNDQVARVWNTETAELLCELRGHQGGVMCAEFSPDGRRVATASEDLSIKLWDLAGAGVPTAIKRGKKIKLAAAVVGD